MKPGKKLVPASFAEVIDSLLDSLLRYKPEPDAPEAAEETAAPAADGPSSMETDTPSQPQPAAQASAENGPAGPSAAPSAGASSDGVSEAERKSINQLRVHLLQIHNTY